MELLIAIVVIGGLGLLAYRSMNKENKDGRHPLDAVTKTDEAPYKVETPATPEVKVEEPAPVVEAAPVVAETAPAKQPRKPRAPKAEKPAAKKAAPKKAAAKTAKKSKKA